MHISIGAAILILGLLYLATTPVGRKVLAVVVVVVAVGVVGVGFLIEREGEARTAQTQREQAVRDDCEKQHPLTADDVERRGILADLERQRRETAHRKAVTQCELKADPAFPGAVAEAKHEQECQAVYDRYGATADQTEWDYQIRTHRCFDYMP
jgi:hypothetical protein